ncbi:MAG: 2-C-methyl-D-erythritol 4-phosphate cytidylyltransferase [Gammaproteobacteria bacterium]
MVNAHWAIIPAAGVGNRMGSRTAKQYLPLAGRSVLSHTIELLNQSPAITGIVLVGDQTVWPEDVFAQLENVQWLSTPGGTERCHSVMKGLDCLYGKARNPESVSVLVHDAARPCLRLTDLQRLIEQVSGSKQGGILATPVSDTIKKSSDSGLIERTLDRQRLWRAQTPQLFLLSILRQSMREAIERELTITDEASAMELAGFRPALIEGHTDNIKITRHEDLAMAEFFLAQQGRL